MYKVLLNEMTPFEYFYLFELGNTASSFSGNLLSWYIIDGGFFTCLALSENSYTNYCSNFIYKKHDSCKSSISHIIKVETKIDREFCFWRDNPIFLIISITYFTTVIWISLTYTKSTFMIAYLLLML
jgi:hypothetical protein